MTFQIGSPKQSGNKFWSVITGTMSALKKLSRQTHEPIKAARGNQPAHIDMPLSKVRRIKGE